MTRRFFFALGALLAVALFTSSAAQARRVVLPHMRPPPDLEVPRQPPPPAGLVAHEWGVFVVQGGQTVHPQELAAELPPFVHRQNGATALVPPPHVGPHPPGVVARKPILFLYADRPMGVTVDVGFAGGAPWMHYPTAAPVAQVTTPNTPGLHWNLAVVPGGDAPMPAVTPGHWWNDLRAVGANTLRAPDGTAERFLFFDGPVAFEPSFLVRPGPNGGAHVSPSSTERQIFLVGNGQYVEADVDPDTRASRHVSQGDTVVALRARLDEALQQRGLSAAEARSLLDTWRDELFTDARRRSIYFVPRAAYDRMLPLRISPTPTQLVRVGLVIDRG